jgi:hypothetical protein
MASPNYRRNLIRRHAATLGYALVEHDAPRGEDKVYSLWTQAAGVRELKQVTLFQVMKYLTKVSNRVRESAVLVERETQ